MKRTLLAAALIASLLVPAGGAGAASPSCDGKPATLVVPPAGILDGTPEADVIVGTAGDDRIRGLGGDDTICGGGGDDVLLGGPGDDVLLGGDGNDRLRGAAGDDRLVGGGGSDRMIPGAGRDRIDGGPGSDVLDYLAAPGPVVADLSAGSASFRDGARTWAHTVTGVEKVDGSRYPDTLTGDDRRNVLRGKQGADTISGGGGNDDLLGGTGRDVIAGGGGDDLIKGQGDGDRISGGPGDDTVRGGGGDDRVEAGGGDDEVLGQWGDDSMAGGPGRDLLAGGPGRDTVSGDDDGDACAAESATGCEGPVIALSRRASVRDAFLRVHRPALDVVPDWTGSVPVCEPGSTSAAYETATLEMVNWYRAMAGLLPVVFDRQWSRKAQSAALMMAANSRLSHSPDPSWSCWTEDGAEAAGRSNLAYGVGGPAAVRAYIDDPGNPGVGHRRWILDPAAVVMGTGSVGTPDWSTPPANALWVVGGGVGSEEAAGTVAWPPAGYVPFEVVGRYWSAGFPSAGLVDATVSMRAGDEPIAVEHPVSGDPASPLVVADTLVWTPAGLDGDRHRIGPGMADLTVTVEVSGVRLDGSPKTITYDVTVFDPDR